MENLMTVQNVSALAELSLDVRLVTSRPAGLSVRTQTDYKAVGVAFNAYLSKTGLTLSPESIKGYLAQVKADCAPATFNLYRQALKTLILSQVEVQNDFMLRAAIKEVFNDCRQVKVDKKIKKDEYLTKAQIESLLQVTTRRNGLIIRALFESGCRISELLSVRLSDCQVNGTCKMRVVGKGSKERTVYISRALYDEIRAAFNGKNWLFETETGKQIDRQAAHKAVHVAGKRIGLDIHPHTFRHSTAMHLLHSEKDPKFVAEFLGHTDVATTLQAYVHSHVDESVNALFQ